MRMKTFKPNTEENVQLRFKLQAFMLQHNLEQKDIAAYTGLSQTSISFILSGARFASENALNKIKSMMEVFEKEHEHQHIPKKEDV